MKIKMKKLPLEKAMAIEPPARKKLGRPWFLFKLLIRLLSLPDLWATKFSYTSERMDKAKGPCLYLMNHSSFIDLKIASRLLFPKSYYIVSTTDGFVGKEWLMRRIGCIPTQKFVLDVALTRDMLRAVKEKKRSVLLFPEAGYTFDGCTTTLPKKLGMLLKKMDVPVVSIITDGAFLRQPLYNELRLRKTKTSAHMKCLLTREEIAEKSVEELDAIINEAFSFDNFRKQAESKTVIDSPDRAVGLQRLLYRCADCGAEGEMTTAGSKITCQKCGKSYELDIYGQLRAVEGETKFSHIPDWYRWQRECVRREIEAGEYRQDLDVDIVLLVDYKALYSVGGGRLVHDENGFVLTDENGKEIFTQSPLASYGLNSDYYWYELDDVICIGNKKRLFYCFPKQKDVVTKARLAAEETYKLLKTNARTAP